MSAAAERAIREVVEERVAAVASKQAAALAARQAPDMVIFDVLPPLRSRGSDAVVEKTRSWFAGYASEIGYEVHELEVHADETIGFCSFVYHVSGTLTTGDVVDMWVRATIGTELRDGQWTIVHDHESVPFDPTTGRAVLGLAPDAC